MLIQNISTTVQAPQLTKLSGDRPVSNGASEIAGATPSNVEVKASAVVNLPQAAEQQSVSTQFQNVVDNINKALKQSNQSLEFTMDANTHKSIVKLVDTETGEIIRQFPTEEILAISRAIDRIQQGLLLKQTA